MFKDEKEGKIVFKAEKKAKNVSKAEKVWEIMRKPKHDLVWGNIIHWK